ncbi:serine/threonine-protein kinase greatwall isoform X3 [Senna tora]|uniref:Serine/threonine-protein kinase greatwall isoform X3 n=1 Tax=Senna tora TaxID=362788 RepID=A0A834SWL6_9FABA|nr:serine/threonine-protein kinase greatwall isoform X3 [Senna tora]
MSKESVEGIQIEYIDIASLPMLNTNLEKQETKFGTSLCSSIATSIGTSLDSSIITSFGTSLCSSSIVASLGTSLDSSITTSFGTSLCSSSIAASLGTSLDSTITTSFGTSLCSSISSISLSSQASELTFPEFEGELMMEVKWNKTPLPSNTAIARKGLPYYEMRRISAFYGFIRSDELRLKLAVSAEVRFKRGATLR